MNVEITHVSQITFSRSVLLFCFAEADGKALETELNQKGPGEALFIYCDVTKEDDIKVKLDWAFRQIYSEKH